MTRKMSFLKKTFLSFQVLGFLCVFIARPVYATEMQSEIDSSKYDSVILYTGDLITVKVKDLTRIAVANPGIVDITNASEDEFTLVGRKVGETQIFVWDANGKRAVLARVMGTDLNLVINRIAALIETSKIKGVSYEKNYQDGKIVLSGYLSKNDKKKLEDLIKPYSDSILNLIIEEGDLIQIDVQFSELDTTLTKTLGFDWTTGSGSLAFTFTEALPAQSTFLDMFKIGNFSRTPAITNVVNLLIQEGKARILSKPSLVVTNGEQASFLVGGEVPVRTTTTSVGGGSSQENVSFKSYGVELQITPEIRDGKIDIKITVTVRDIDTSYKTTSDVAFLTRTATTKVRLTDGQTVVFAGMIQRRKSENINRVMFLSKIPVIGMLFRQIDTNPNTEQELVVSLTPRILKEMANGRLRAKTIAGDEEIEPVRDSAKQSSAPAKIKPAAAPKSKKDGKSSVKTRSVPAKDKKSTPPDTSRNNKEIPAVKEKPGQMTKPEPLKNNGKSAEDPSLNMAMDDPQLSDPQNILSDKDIAAIRDKYTQKIKQQMAETISYPYEAKEAHWEGTVQLNMTILPDGNVKTVNVGQSSGYAIFDKDAVNTAEILAPYDHFAPAKNLRQLEINVPVEYSEKAILGTPAPDKK